MCAAPYNDFEDSYTIVSSSSISRNVGSNIGIIQDQDDGDGNSVHSILIDNGDKGCKDLSVQEWVHLITSFLNMSAYLAFAGFLMYKYTTDSDHYVFSSLIIIKFVFSNYFLFAGIKREQPFHILMQMMTSVSLFFLDLIYYLNDISTPPTNSDLDQIGLELMLFYLRSILCLLTLLTASIIAWRYWTIEQAIFKTVGTDMRRVSVFRNLFFGFSLMVFDMEISLVSLTLFLRNGITSIQAHEIVVMVCGAAFLLFWILLGYKAMRSESLVLTWTFILVSCIQPAYLIVLFIRNVKFAGVSEPVLTASSHYMSFVALTVHLSVVAAVIVGSHYYGAGYGDALVNGVHVSVKNSAEYEELRRILFHPINPRSFYRNQNDPSSSHTVLLNAEVY